MWYLYLDESGDLGFDFISKKPSRFFTIVILAVFGWEDHKRILQAVKRTLHRKVPKAHELKASKSSLEVKRYFYRQIADVKFELYAMTLSKKETVLALMQDKGRIYNFITGYLLSQIPFEKATTNIQFVVDRSKGFVELEEFNQDIVQQLQGRIDPKVKLDIWHRRSQEHLGIQAADLFAWGFFRKNERRDSEWFDVYKGKVKFDGFFKKDEP